jgi:hypothetical protein
MLDRRRWLPAGKVLGTDLGEVDVGAEQRRPYAVLDDFLGTDEIEQVVSREVCYDERQRCRGKDPAPPTGVESDERDRPATRRLGEKEPSD